MLKEAGVVMRPRGVATGYEQNSATRKEHR
jgi:hypothetical protein